MVILFGSHKAYNIMEINKENGIHWLRNSLNQSAENGVKKIKKSLLTSHLDFGYKSLDSKSEIHSVLDWNDIMSCLSEWEKNKWIKIVSDPLTSCEDSICIEDLKYLGGGPWKSGGDLPK